MRTLRPALLSVLVLVAPDVSAQSGLLWSAEENVSTLRTLDPTTGRTRAVHTLQTVNGRPVPGVTAMAWDAASGRLVVATQPLATGARYLAAVDPATGNAVLGPTLGELYDGFSIDDAGLLWGVTAEASSTPESLFLVDPATGSETLVAVLGLGGALEALAYQPADRLLYHASGRGFPNDPVNGEILETIDPVTGTRGTRTLTGVDYDGARAFLPLSADLFFLADATGAAYLLDATGLVSALFPLDHAPSAVAFSPDPSTRAAATPYAFGCPGTGGYVAALLSADPPAPGRTATLRGFQAHASPTAPAVLLFGLGNGSLPLTPGCSLHVLPALQIFLPLTWNGSGPGTGRLEVSFPIPPNTFPGDVFTQILWLDGTALLVTNPLHLHVE